MASIELWIQWCNAYGPHLPHVPSASVGMLFNFVQWMWWERWRGADLQVLMMIFADGCQAPVYTVQHPNSFKLKPRRQCEHKKVGGTWCASRLAETVCWRWRRSRTSASVPDWSLAWRGCVTLVLCQTYSQGTVPSRAAANRHPSLRRATPVDRQSRDKLQKVREMPQKKGFGNLMTPVFSKEQGQI